MPENPYKSPEAEGEVDCGRGISVRARRTLGGTCAILVGASVLAVGFIAAMFHPSGLFFAIGGGCLALFGIQLLLNRNNRLPLR